VARSDGWNWTSAIPLYLGRPQLRFISLSDNVYDGSAMRAASIDQWGYACGGEAGDYGNFTGAVTQTNSNLAAAHPAGAAVVIQGGTGGQHSLRKPTPHLLVPLLMLSFEHVLLHLLVDIGATGAASSLASFSSSAQSGNCLISSDRYELCRVGGHTVGPIAKQFGHGRF
jgi:hypothetical protein